MKAASAVLVLALVLAFFPIGARAQSNLPPTPPVQHFSLSGNISGLMGTSGTQGAVIASAGMQLTQRVSAGYEHISVSSINARWELGVLGYTLPLSALVGKRLNSKLVFDASKINVTFSAGGGKLLQPTHNNIAETAGVHISYPLSDHISVELVGLDVLHGGVHTGFLTSNITEAISTGLNFSF